MNTRLNKPELMSPAGGWPQLKTAIEAGADAVYFGLNHFSARAKVGFTLEELPDVMRTLHERGVNGYVTFNTLVFDHEIDEARRVLNLISEANVDAVIVQDVGIARDILTVCPQLEIHGSTQMSITSAQGAEFARQLGCRRVVLGRELSVADIARIQEQLVAAGSDVELEVFVHGALCVSYSGQCFSSEAWGGRSANRGQCAQACRLSYDLIVDGSKRDLGEFRYLLSPGDLYAIEQVPDLVKIGVACLKIEGRYKDSDYVAIVTSAYRTAIDRAWDEQPHQIDEKGLQDIEHAYSRGLGSHFISGTNHQTVVNGRAPRHRGVQVGTVTSVGNNFVEVELVQRSGMDIARGDGLVFDAAQRRSPDEPEEGGFVYDAFEIEADAYAIVRRLKFGDGMIKFNRIAPGDYVWRTHDPKLSGKYSRLTKATKPVFTRPVQIAVIARFDRPLRITASTDDGIHAEYVGTSKATTAKKHAFDEAIATEQLGRLGGTPFHLGTLTLDCVEQLFIPVSELNSARRELIESLLSERRSRTHQTDIADTDFASVDKPNREFVLQSSLDLKAESNRPASNRPAIHLLIRRPDQLPAAIESRPESITLDYLDLYGLRPSVESVHAADIECRVASPRILKPAEQNIIRFLLSLECGILVRSAGLLYDFLHEDRELPPLYGDFSLNVANRLSLDLFLQRGLRRITPSHDLNAAQISALADEGDPETIEVIAFQHLPVFHTEHCVFCRFLSNGTDNTNCGHPCESHQVLLRDNNGRAHPVMADVGCRNTVFGTEPQTAEKYLKQWLATNVRHFRLEFVHQTGEQIGRIADSFRQFFDGQINAHFLRKSIEKEVGVETTDGSLYVPADSQPLYQIT